MNYRNYNRHGNSKEGRKKIRAHRCFQATIAIALIARRTALLLFPGLVLFSSPLSAVCVYVHSGERVPAPRLLYVVRQSLLRGCCGRKPTRDSRRTSWPEAGSKKTTRRAFRSDRRLTLFLSCSFPAFLPPPPPRAPRTSG